MTPKLYINTRNRIEVIRLDDVAYLKADGNYTEFHLTDGKERVQLSTPLRLCRRHRTRLLCQRHSLAILSHGEKLDCEPRPRQLC